MSTNNRKSLGKMIAVAMSSLVIVATIAISQQRVPAVSENTRIYDKGLVDVLREIEGEIPEDEPVVVSTNGPHVVYFSGREVEVPRGVVTLRELVEYMWKKNSTYLLTFENKAPEPELRRLLNKDSRFLDNAFDKISSHSAVSGKVDLYHLQSNVTYDNIDIVADIRRPELSIEFPANHTTIEANSKQPILINATGTAFDADSEIKEVEVRILNETSYKLATPSAPGNWSTWSFSDFIDSEGTKRIVARATDNAGYKNWIDINVTVNYRD